MNLIDMHCDTFWKFMNEPGKYELSSNSLCIDLEKMKKAESLAQFFACFIHMKQLGGDYAKGYAFALDTIALAKSEFEKNKESIALAGNYEEIMRNQSQGKMSAILTIEEGGILDGKMERLDTLYENGIRLMTLTWNGENCIGYPNSAESEQMKFGLKPFGVETVQRMNEIGMIIDVSHLSDGGFWDVLEHSKKPVVASHSNCRAVCDHRRNLSDDMIRALAEKGGISGLNFYPTFLKEDKKATVEDMARHIYHMYQVGGEDFPAMGTDFDGYDDGENEITDMSQMHMVYDAVKKQGFTERQMDKIWSGNILRVIRACL